MTDYQKDRQHAICRQTLPVAQTEWSQGQGWFHGTPLCRRVGVLGVCRGFTSQRLSGSSWESAVGFATASLCGFAVFGAIAGRMAEGIVEEAIRSPAGNGNCQSARFLGNPARNADAKLIRIVFVGRNGSVAAVKN